AARDPERARRQCTGGDRAAACGPATHADPAAASDRGGCRDAGGACRRAGQVGGTEQTGGLKQTRRASQARTAARPGRAAGVIAAEVSIKRSVPVLIAPSPRKRGEGTITVIRTSIYQK